jgi:RND family efflux transporter MFP subunit
VRTFLAFAVMLFAGCRAGKPGLPATPPPEVSVGRPVAREISDWDEYAGRLQSPETANVTARVSGFVEDVPFKEGALVKKGDALFIIDARPFTAELENRQATVQKDEAQLVLADAELQRSAELLKKKTIAQQDFDIRKAQSGQAIAQLAADKAAEETARLNLEWTRVTAPIAGRVSRMNVTAGNQVSIATLLTTIVSVDPMYCYVSVPGRTFLQYQQITERQKGENVHRVKIPCSIGLETEEGFPHEGVIDFIDNAVDPNTGTIQMRGVIPNPSGLLTPGTFARMRIVRGAPYKALLVPDQAVGAQQTERYLLVVGKDDVVVSRPIKTGALFGNLRAIVSGLEPDDRVVVNGMQRAEPGGKVTPKEIAIPDETSGSSKSAASSEGAEQNKAARP